MWKCLLWYIWLECYVMVRIYNHCNLRCGTLSPCHTFRLKWPRRGCTVVKRKDTCHWIYTQTKYCCKAIDIISIYSLRDSKYPKYLRQTRKSSNVKKRSWQAKPSTYFRRFVDHHHYHRTTLVQTIVPLNIPSLVEFTDKVFFARAKQTPRINTFLTFEWRCQGLRHSTSKKSTRQIPRTSFALDKQNTRQSVAMKFLDRAILCWLRSPSRFTWWWQLQPGHTQMMCSSKLSIGCANYRIYCPQGLRERWLKLF